MNENAKQAKVAKVLTQYKVILNVGARDGINVGDDFIIYRIGDEVQDPDTGESLGVYEEIIGRGTVTHLQDAISTLESSDVKQSGRKVIKRYRPADQIVGLASLFSNSPTEEIIEEPEGEAKPFSYARVGDYAKIIPDW